MALHKYGALQPSQPSSLPPFIPTGGSFPAKHSLRRWDGPIIDQDPTGGCSGACAADFAEAILHRQGRLKFAASWLALYYWGRQSEGTQGADVGAILSDVFSVMQNMGVPRETAWPGNPSNVLVAPPAAAVANAAQFKLTNPTMVPQTLEAIQELLVSGCPVGIAFFVYQSFELNAPNGNIPMPNTQTETLYGAHALILDGYNNVTQRFGIKQSWGTGWGTHGYGTMPYEYVLDQNLTFQLVSGSTIT